MIRCPPRTPLFSSETAGEAVETVVFTASDDGLSLDASFAPKSDRSGLKTDAGPEVIGLRHRKHPWMFEPEPSSSSSGVAKTGQEKPITILRPIQRRTCSLGRPPVFLPASLAKVR